MVNVQTGAWALYPLCILLAALLAVALFGLARRRGGAGHAVPAWQMAVLVPLASFVGARLLYVLFSFDVFLYDYGLAAVFDPRAGGCLMAGAVAGACLCAALLARRAHAPVGASLDELVVPGLAALALCRLAEVFTGEGIGSVVEREAFCFFPLAAANQYGEWNLAVFVYEAVAALAILLAAARMKARAPGERFTTALLLLCCCQIPLENLRSDNCLRIGFVRVTQIFAALAILSIVLLRARPRGRRAMGRGALAVLLCAAGIGVIEWAQDKTNIPNAALYAAMIALCVVMALCARQAPDRRDT